VQLSDSPFVNPKEHRGFFSFLSLHPELRSKFAKFSAAMGGKGIPSPIRSCRDLFGERSVTYYYQPDRKEEFEKHLESLFLATNPNPSRYLRSTFTKLLHEHNLHWSQCGHQHEFKKTEKGSSTTRRKRRGRPPNVLKYLTS
jgi:hypothetical protein